MQRRLIFFGATAIVTAVAIQYDIMIVKRSVSNYNQNQREEFMYRQLDDTINKQKYIEHERENTRDSGLLQGEIAKQRFQNNRSKSIYLRRFD